MTKGERVKKIRKMNDLTLSEFGEKLGVSAMAISNIERGNRRLTSQMSKAICVVFEINSEWLEDGTGEMLQTLSPDEEIAGFVGRMLSKADDCFQKKILYFLARLTPEDWKVFEVIWNAEARLTPEDWEMFEAIWNADAREDIDQEEKHE